MPGYQRIAEEVLRMLGSGELGKDFTVPEATEKIGVKEWNARRACEWLAERGILESHQGSGYSALVTPEQAAALRTDDRSLRVQLAEVQQAVAELRRDVPPGLSDRLEWVVTAIEQLHERFGFDLPGESDERGEEPAPAARRGHTG